MALRHQRVPMSCALGPLVYYCVSYVQLTSAMHVQQCQVSELAALQPLQVTDSTQS